jgi:methionyl aminopeptidase
MSDLCWCGSGKLYEVCHKPIEEKMQAFQKRGCTVPNREMLKTPAQIAGIRKACEINTAVLDEVAKHIKTGMSTEEIDQLVYKFTVSKKAIPAPLGFCGFPRACAPR